MAITNHERVGKSLDLLKLGLQPFVERRAAKGTDLDSKGSLEGKSDGRYVFFEGNFSCQGIRLAFLQTM